MISSSLNTLTYERTNGVSGAMRMTCRRRVSHFFGITLFAMLLMASNCVAKYAEGHLKTLDVRIVNLSFLPTYVFQFFLNSHSFRIGHFWRDSVLYRVAESMNLKLISTGNTVNHNCCCTLTIKRNGHRSIKVAR